MERIAWRTTVHGVEKSRIQLGNFHFISQVLLVVKNPAASAGDTRDASLIPGLGRSSGLGIGKSHSIILAWGIPWTEEPGGLQSMGLQRVGHD